MNQIFKKQYTCYFDGCCEPKNPGGEMGIGIHITDGTHIFEKGYTIPAKFGNTNNIAEYMAIIEVLKLFEKKQDCMINIFGDSKLVIEQMNERWGSNGGAYSEFMYQAKLLLKQISVKNKVLIDWIPREKNELADIQSKKHIKEVRKWKRTH